MPKHGKRINKQQEEEIKQLSERYNIDIDILTRIIKDFDTLDNFRDNFIKYILQNGKIQDEDLIKNYLNLLDGRIIKGFDLNSEDLICRENNYLTFNREDSFPVFYDVQKYKNATLEKIKSISSVNYQVIKLFFGLDEKKHTKMEIAQKLGITKGKIDKILKDVVTKYNETERINDGIYNVDDWKKRNYFIQTYFKDNDIFYDSNIKDIGYRKDIISTIFNDNLEEYKIRVEKRGDKTGINRILRNLKGCKSNVVDTMERLYEMKNINEWTEERILLSRIEALDKKLKKSKLKDKYIINNENEFNELFREYKDIERRSIIIDQLDLFESTSNCLKREGILILNNLLEKDIQYIKTLNWIYPSQKEAIISKVHSLGYSFVDEKEETEETKERKKQIEIQDSSEKILIKNEELEKITTSIKAQIEPSDDSKTKPYNLMNRIQKVEKNDLEDWQKVELEKLKKDIQKEIDDEER